MRERARISIFSFDLAMIFNKLVQYKTNKDIHDLGSVHGEKVVLGDIPPKWKNVEISINSDMLPRR